MLIDAQCRNATCPPDKKTSRLTDGTGLYLEISPAGSKRWFQKIYRNGKESRLALGSYPAESLAAAQLQPEPRSLSGAYPKGTRLSVSRNALGMDRSA